MLTAVSAWAYDLEDDCYGYTIISEEEQTASIENCKNWFYYTTIIPETVQINGKTYTVTSIGRFYGGDVIQTLIIPKTIKHIKEGAFGSTNVIERIIVVNNGTFDSREDCNAIIETATNTLVIGCKNTVIPKTVTSISPLAFNRCSGLTSISIPEGVRSIDGATFSDCSELTSVSIPNSVTEISPYAFRGCDNLSSLNEYDNALYLGSEENPYLYLFKVKDKNISSCSLNNNTKSICCCAFEKCHYLTSIIIPNGVTEIADGTFRDCSSLSSISIPNTVKSIGNFAFQNCTSLSSVTIPSSVTSIGTQAFSYCTDLTSAVIQEGVTTIESSAFSGCSSLTSINIPKGVTTIRTSTFSSCLSLTSVTIPNSVTSIEANAFSGCSSLASITIPNSVTWIGNNIIQGCKNLETIIVEDGNTKFDSRNNCNAIIESETNTLIAGCKNTIIPNSVISIGENAFYCQSELISIDIPDEVTSIHCSAFSGCNNLQGKEYDNAVYIGNSENEYLCLLRAKNNTITSCIINENTKTITSRAFYGCNHMTSVSIPTSMTEINDEAFDECSGLTSVFIPNSVTTIGQNAFSNCSNLSLVFIPNSVTSIGYGAFYNCSSLSFITIPSSVMSIEMLSLGWCKKLRAIRFESETPCKIGLNEDYKYTFAWSPNIEVFYIPEGTTDKYVEQWGRTYGDWSGNKININYIEFNKLPTIENTVGGDAIVVDVNDNDNEVTLSIKLDEGFSLDKIIINGVVSFPCANKSQKMVSVTDLGEGKYLVCGVTNEDNIKVVYTDGTETPTAIKGIATSYPTREGIYDILGHKLSAPQHGVNIINGKKVVVK